MSVENVQEVESRLYPGNPGGPLPSDTALDQDALRQLRDLSQSCGVNILEQVIDIFLDDSPRLMKSMETAVRDGDSKGLRMAAHALKSSSANLGAISFSEVCARLEEMGRNSQLEGVEDLLESAIRFFSKVKTDLVLERKRVA